MGFNSGFKGIIPFFVISEKLEVKEKSDIIDIIERKRLQWYGHVKRMQDERLPKLIMEWIPGERRKRGRPRKTWMEGVGAAMKTRHLEANQWLNRKEWCWGSGRRRQLSQDRKDRTENRKKWDFRNKCTENKISVSLFHTTFVRNVPRHKVDMRSEAQRGQQYPELEFSGELWHQSPTCNFMKIWRL